MSTIVQPWETRDEPQTWSNVGVSALGAMPRSTYKAGKEMVQALLNPIDTGMAILNMMQGALHLALPDDLQAKFDPNGKTEETQEMARQVGEHFANKYGGEENIKHVLSNDPASVLMDVASVFTMGGGLAAKAGSLSKIPNLEKAGNQMSKAGTVIDPVLGSIQGVAKAGTYGTIAGRELFGKTSGVSGSTIDEVFDVSRTSSKEAPNLKRGDDGTKLTEAMRQKDFDLQPILQIVHRDLDVMKKQKQENYKKNKEQWGQDNALLDFKDIDAAMIRARNMVEFRGKSKNPKGSLALDDLQAIIDDWKNLDPATHHDVMGMDALKQTMWSVVEGVDMNNATASGVAKNIYHAVGDTIKKQAPGYAKAMKEYQDASEVIQDITKTLSLKKGANVDTAIRKLTSLLRDNVNTNYGQRVKLARMLEDVGGEAFMPQIAGSQMNSLMPRGIQGAITPSAAFGTGVAGAIEPLTAGAIMATSSPRILGETTNMAGYLMGKLDKLPKASYEGIEGLLEILYQSQAVQENKQNR